MKSRFCLLLAAALCLIVPLAAVRADPAPFDLAGPVIEAGVTRDGVSLPISRVPNLSAGDHLWIRADLPTTQSEHYLLVVAFLRGSTNPPPPRWFTVCATWSETCGRDGIDVTVPHDAQQVLLFLAPQTSGDFKTLVNAVRGRPGAFVRASQDLNQATLDRSRLDTYLQAVHELNETDQMRLQQAAPLLARSLAIKVDSKCLGRTPELQASCLEDSQNSLILNDGHSTSMVEALTSGSAADLVMEASSTPQLNYGYYSPYIASIMDIGRILSSFHTAQYQYIPALATQRGDEIALTLNTPPSFYNPKSVLVAALPAVEQPQLPPLHAVNPDELYCARKTSLVLPVDGAPLVFSTGYAHHMTLSLTGQDGRRIDLRARADAKQGGFVVDTTALHDATLGESVHGSLHGFWGFDPYTGPSFSLVNTHAEDWVLPTADEGSLIVGREDTVHLQAGNVSCIDSIMLRDPAGKEVKAEWKSVRANEVELKLPLQETTPGALTLLIKQYGAPQPQPVTLQAFSEAGHLDSFTLHAGDVQGVLRGTRLDEVASLTLQGTRFVPGKLASSQGSDDLQMTAMDAKRLGELQPGEQVRARVTLKDGRTFDLKSIIDASRPRVTLIGKSVETADGGGESHIQLADPDELPQAARLTFSVRAQPPAVFSHDDQIEVASTDQSFSTRLNLDNGGMMLEDARVAVATLDPARSFGTSAFGPLQFRIISNGVTGDWQPLATLVRLPALMSLKCPVEPERPCLLSGSNLFLVDAVSGEAKFTHDVRVPDGFPGAALQVPHPVGDALYLKLRDDPSAVNEVTLQVQPLPPTSAELARESTNRAARTGVPLAPSGGPPVAAAAPDAAVSAGAVASPAAGSTAVASPAVGVDATALPAAGSAAAPAAAAVSRRTTALQPDEPTAALAASSGAVQGSQPSAAAVSVAVRSSPQGQAAPAAPASSPSP